MTDHDTSASQNIKYPHWQREFEAALLEGDPQKLRQLVDAAEAAIFCDRKHWWRAHRDTPSSKLFLTP